MQKGRIVKSLSGFYNVNNELGTFQCKGRGVFRKRKITPLVGDIVSFNLDENDEGYITDIEPRKNELVRPPVANVDQAIIMSSAKHPDFNPKLLDRFLVLIESARVTPIIFVTKMDLATEAERDNMQAFKAIYEKAGYDFQLLSIHENMEQVIDYFSKQISVIAGQSGVGKSSILNALKPSLDLQTGHISKSLGRGKHTTRHVELVEINGGLVADTPGFSSLDFDRIEQEELSMYFPEMSARQGHCKFRGCLHDREPHCAIKLAVTEGDIAPHRYEHYLEFLKNIQSRKPRY